MHTHTILSWIYMKKIKTLVNTLVSELNNYSRFAYGCSHLPVLNSFISLCQHRHKWNLSWMWNPQNFDTWANLEKNQGKNRNIKAALKTCGYPEWAFTKTSKRQDTGKEEERNKRHSISILCLTGVLEKFRKILRKQFKLSNTLRKNRYTQKTRQQHTNKATLSLPYSARRNAQICILVVSGKPG